MASDYNQNRKNANGVIVVHLRTGTNCHDSEKQSIKLREGGLYSSE